MQQASGHEDSWAPARRAAASFLAQGGTLDGLTGLRRGLVLDLTPELTGTTAARPTPPAAGGTTPRDPGVGGTVRWGVTSNLTLNGTANPDFSQIEADASQVTFDPRSALFFAEKRPFFLDGLEQFQTPNRLIYTRRIVDPVGAVKLSGKVGGTSLAFLSAVDAEAQSAGGDHHPRYNVMRVQRDLFGQSKAALVVTDKVDGPDSNRVAAADARFAWGEIWNLQLQAGGSPHRARRRDAHGAAPAGEPRAQRPAVRARLAREQPGRGLPRGERVHRAPARDERAVRPALDVLRGRALAAREPVLGRRALRDLATRATCGTAGGRSSASCTSTTTRCCAAAGAWAARS